MSGVDSVAVEEKYVCAVAEEEVEMAEAWFGVCMAFLYFLGGLEVLTRHDSFLGVIHEFRS